MVAQLPRLTRILKRILIPMLILVNCHIQKEEGDPNMNDWERNDEPDQREISDWDGQGGDDHCPNCGSLLNVSSSHCNHCGWPEFDEVSHNAWD